MDKLFCKTVVVFFSAVFNDFKIDAFCRTCFSMGDLGVQVSVRPFVHPSIFTLGVL